MKYKVGERVRIVSETTEEMNWVSEMDMYLGRAMTIKSIVSGLIFGGRYIMAEDKGNWFWYDNMIVGLASETPFDFGAWKDKNVCMHCKTREEDRDFRCEMEKAGLGWNGGDSYLDKSCFNHYEDLTCYYFNEGTYDSAEYVKNRGDQILEWADYRSTEPKVEQEKIMETKIDDKPLNFTEAMKIRKRLCASMRDVCKNCPLSSDNNDTTKSCDDFMLDHPDMAEPILKEWIAEHPFKTNEQKCNEMFLEVFGVQYATALMHPDWWQQEYVEPFEGKE